MIDTDAIRTRYEAVAPLLNERARRVWAAGEVLAAGRGGIAAVSRGIGMGRSTIGRGVWGGARRDCGGLAGDRHGAQHDRPRACGGAGRQRGACGSGASSWWWRQAGHRDAAWVVAGAGRAGAVLDPRRSRGAAALGEPKPAAAVGGPERTRL